MNIAMIGTGYVGLVTGTCLAEVGNSVVCVDKVVDKVDDLNAGLIPIMEPGLEPMVESNRRAGRLSFTTDISAAVKASEVIFIAVGTPADDSGAANREFVLAAAQSIGEAMTMSKTVVTKSTVPVGTAQAVKRTITDALRKRALSIDFDVVSNPEFLKEGSAIDDFQKPDRIVVGAETNEAIEKMRELYRPFNRNRDRVIAMDIISSELTKYAANAMLASRISFMNEMANIAERVGADIENVRRGIGSDPRIGHHFIYPGCGYGGSCFPKDISALARTAQSWDYDTPLLDAIQAVNQRQKLILASKITRRFGDCLEGRRFAIWGLAFKPDTDDMREAPSDSTIRALCGSGAQVVAYDPIARRQAERQLSDVEGLSFVDDAYAALQGAHALLVLTESREFRSPDLLRIGALLEERIIFDGRNVFDLDSVESHGFEYFGIGRGAANASLFALPVG
jgi:UDPglucose 6-dehydrogenase